MTHIIVILSLCILASGCRSSSPPKPKLTANTNMACIRRCQDSHSKCNAACTGKESYFRECNAILGQCYETCQ